ncbi:MAG: hypothetical protein Tsb002_14180 [Wenzhouxiangellaceae bacterium]
MNQQRTRDSEASQQKILDAAERLFIEQGYSATSLRQVAADAGVTKSLIFHHFQTKLELWNQVKARRMGAYAQRQHEVFDQGVISLDNLTGAIRDYFELLRDDPALVQLLARAQLDSQEHRDRFDLKLVEQFISRLQRAQHNGLLRHEVQPACLLAIILSAVNHWFEARQHFKHWPDFEQTASRDHDYLNTFLDVLLHGVLPRENQGHE